jgi:putative endonuclease
MISLQRSGNYLSREPCVYILANAGRERSIQASLRIWHSEFFQHRQDLTPSCTSRYGCNRLVFYERYDRMDEAMAREKQVEGGSRPRKIALIEAMNPDWKDLHNTLA